MADYERLRSGNIQVFLDLLDLNPFRRIAIMTPADYLARET